MKKSIVAIFATVYIVGEVFSSLHAQNASSADFDVAVTTKLGLAPVHEAYMQDFKTGTYRLLGISMDTDSDGMVDTSVTFIEVTAQGIPILAVSEIPVASRIQAEVAKKLSGSPIVKKRPMPEHADNERIRGSDAYKFIIKAANAGAKVTSKSDEIK